MQNYFDPFQLQLEDARQRLVQYGHLSQYKSGVKSILRKELIKVLVENSSDNGVKLFNPEYSDEAILFLEQRNNNEGFVVIVESDERTAKNLRYVYNDYGITVLDHTFVDIVDIFAVPVSTAHFDFCGEFNSPKTQTHAINTKLKGELTDQACLAYTHSAGFRSCPPALDFGLDLWEDLTIEFPEVGKYYTLFGLDTFDMTKPKCINQILWFNPSVLTWASNVLVHHETHHVELIDSCKYRQLQKTTAKPTRGNVYMNRGIFKLTKGEFDIQASIESIFKNNRDKIN